MKVFINPEEVIKGQLPKNSLKNIKTTDCLKLLQPEKYTSNINYILGILTL